ncbi:MAG TPA: azurin, partial [Pirellulaceae bacterium]|nr:azurin [Pirellulaceae bacterium]
PLTVNGIHLTELGNQSLATIIDATLFADIPSGDRSSERQAKIRAAVLDKNFHWYQRYRTTDGYSIYGGRADLKFTDGQTNREVAQREMEILDVMTANRDKVIWAAAQGRELAVDDSNTPDFIPVISNKQGSGPNGTFEFLSGESAIGNMEVAKGMKINLFADEAMFPEMVNPVQMAFDTKGRLWVAVWESYPHWKPKDKMDDKLLILEDTNGDGRADVCKTFAGGLHNPTGFEFWGGGVLIATAPEIYFLKDTDGDDVADERTRVVSGIDSADTHHGSNSFVFDPGGGVYFQEGTFHQSQVETPWGPVRRCSNAGVFRYEPRTQKFDVHVTHGFANPHGHVFDYWGRDIIHDGTGAVPYDGALFSGHLEYPAKHARPPTVYQQRTRPCGGTEILSSGHFPDELQGNLLVSNVIGFQGILQYKLNDDGASFTGTEVEPIVYSSDPNFRPIDIEIAPDGSLYFTDWQNPIIGHMQHNLRDPNRDRTHGRVYRVTYPSRPLLTPPKIAGESIENLLELLKDK